MLPVALLADCLLRRGSRTGALLGLRGSLLRGAGASRADAPRFFVLRLNLLCFRLRLSMLVLRPRRERRCVVALVLSKFCLFCELHLLGRQICRERRDARDIEHRGVAGHDLLGKPAQLLRHLGVGVDLLRLHLLEWLLELHEVLRDERGHWTGHYDWVL